MLSTSQMSQDIAYGKKRKRKNKKKQQQCSSSRGIYKQITSLGRAFLDYEVTVLVI